jgi:serum/glucocorticoid-regulated kinase 2
VTTGQKLPIYYREELNLVNYATTKEEKKKEGIKDIKGEFVMHDDVSFQVYLEGEEKEKEMVRKTTRTLYSRNNLKEEVTINDFVPKIVLGKGAFGTVLLVEKKNTKELFAMKSINKDDIVKKDQI